MLNTQDHVDSGNAILRGVREIAEVIRINTRTAADLIDRKVIPTCRFVQTKESRGTFYTTKNLVIEAIEREVKKQSGLPQTEKPPY